MKRLAALALLLFGLAALCQTCPINVTVATPPVYASTVTPRPPGAVPPLTVTVSQSQSVAVTISPDLLVGVSALVPYTGATKAVDLGNYSLKAAYLTSVGFATGDLPVPASPALAWDSTVGSWKSWNGSAWSAIGGSVTTDSSLTGDGTGANPLALNVYHANTWYGEQSIPDRFGGLRFGWYKFVPAPMNNGVALIYTAASPAPYTLMQVTDTSGIEMWNGNDEKSGQPKTFQAFPSGDIWNAGTTTSEGGFVGNLSGVATDASSLNGQSASYYQTALGYTPLNKAGDTATGLQIWAAGGYIGGQKVSDAEPEYTVISGKGAYPLATSHVTGGPLVLSGGYGVSQITVTNYALLYGGQIQVILNDRLPNKALYVLTEGVEFSASTSNAVTAANIAAAVNGWIPGCYATASGALVGLEKAPAITNVNVSLPGLAPGLSVVNQEYGQTYLDGPVTALYQFALQGETLLPLGQSQSLASGALAIDASQSTCVALSANTAQPVAGMTPLTIGKTVVLLFADANVTIANSSPFALAGAFNSSANAVLCLRYDGSLWRELFRYPNFVAAPATATSAGTPGQYAYDSGYIYICIAANTWLRAPIATW